MPKTATVQLTFEQIEVLRGVLFEYYSQNTPFDEKEESVRFQLEAVLADAEDELYFGA